MNAVILLVADALVSLGVVIAGAVYLWQGWGCIDPVMSLVIALVVVVGTWSLFHRLWVLGSPAMVDYTF